ncbi:Epidermal patterning factor-like protein, partial [Psidium guajava]
VKLEMELGLKRVRGHAGAWFICSISLLSIWTLSLSHPTPTPPPPPPCVGLHGILGPPPPGKPRPHYLKEQVSEIMVVGGRRELRTSGPGSSPPRCNSKCGKCTPCKPVHVPVQPGRPVLSEYYPEAWRCKCGNKLFMP